MELDLFKADKKTIDTQKVVFRLWENRKNMDKVKELADMLCKFADEKRVFKDIEFYLPQLAHLIIHMDVSPRNAALEKLAMVISQNSMHAALQLNFLFNAAMEDYQPEMANGKPNSACNPFYFGRCARLVQDIERAVIFGSSDNPQDSPIATPERNTRKMGMIDRQLTSETSVGYDGILNGQLYYKRYERKSIMHTKPWKLLYFVVDQRVLLCYREPHAVHPKRSIALQNCRVLICETSEKYGDTLFELVNESNSSHCLLRAETPEARQKWVRFLENEITGTPQVRECKECEEEAEVAPSTSSLSKRAPLIDESSLTPVQRKRFAYFKQMRIFLTNLTNICERLRFKERSVRRFFLERDMKDLLIPPLVYVPMASSIDEFCTILRALPKDCHAFSTKARVPALMLFEVEAHPGKADLATFLGVEMEKYSEEEVVMNKIALVHNHRGSIVDGDTEETEVVAIENRPSKFADHRAVRGGYWAAEGSGLTRLTEAGINVEAALGGNALKASSADGADKAHLNTSMTSILTESNVPVPEADVGPFGETFAQKAARLRAISPYGHLPGWKVGGLIAKSNDDVRQEVFVMQLISYYQRAFQEAGLPVFLHSYRIMSTSKSTGLIELITDAISIDGLKKREDFPGTLRAWYEMTFGYDANAAVQSDRFKEAMNNYISSMAGYSIITYLLAIKDRHNGNIMLDTHGHVIHIDFGFVFGLAPGKQFSMEKAPWKLNRDLADVMGGHQAPEYNEYRNRCVQAFLVARKHAKQVVALMEIMQFHSNYPCFRYNQNAIADFRSRLFLDHPDADISAVVEKMLNRSYNHSGTDLYDSFQLATNGIAK